MDSLSEWRVQNNYIVYFYSNGNKAAYNVHDPDLIIKAPCLDIYGGNTNLTMLDVGISPPIEHVSSNVTTLKKLSHKKLCVSFGQLGSR